MIIVGCKNPRRAASGWLHLCMHAQLLLACAQKDLIINRHGPNKSSMTLNCTSSRLFTHQKTIEKYFIPELQN